MEVKSKDISSIVKTVLEAENHEVRVIKLACGGRSMKWLGLFPSEGQVATIKELIAKKYPYTSIMVHVTNTPQHIADRRIISRADSYNGLRIRVAITH
jgi:hypothetical protein